MNHAFRRRFIRMTLAERIKCVSRQGKQLFLREFFSYRIYLFSVDNFYVELWYHLPSSAIEKIEFASDRMMKQALEQVNTVIAMPANPATETMPSPSPEPLSEKRWPEPKGRRAVKFFAGYLLFFLFFKLFQPGSDGGAQTSSITASNYFPDESKLFVQHWPDANNQDKPHTKAAQDSLNFQN